MTSATRHDLRHVGSLITVGDAHCLGYLIAHKGDVFDANLGKVDVSAEDAHTHNRLLDEAMIKGLDENCAVGQGGTFFWKRTDGQVVVRTWLGQQVSDRATLNGVVLTFHRGKMIFRGRVQKAAECFNFTRIE